MNDEADSTPSRPVDSEAGSGTRKGAPSFSQCSS
jgi:hypothetical protein